MSLLKKNRRSGRTATAIIAAAGSSLRMEGRDKLFCELAGVPVLASTISCYENCADIDDIIVVCRKQSLADVYKLCDDMYFEKISAIIPGGSTRQLSVAAGIDSLPAGTSLIAVADGDRPFTLPGDISNCISAAQEYGAAALARPVTDTLKRVGKDRSVLFTVDRSEIYAVQTPQVFRAEEYKAALEKAMSSGLDYTDDCQLYEALGLKVVLVDAQNNNMKITTPDDLDLAQAYMIGLIGGSHL